MWEEKFIERYNHWIGRENKAVAYFEANPEKVTDKMINEYYKIVKELSKLMQEYKNKFGQDMDQEEILKGFKI